MTFPAGSRRVALLAVLLGPLGACATAPPPVPETVEAPAAGRRLDPFLDTLQVRTFDWFWDLAHPVNGLVPDRAPTPSFSSIAAIGFGLTAYIVGVERDYVTRDEAAERVRRTLEFLWRLPQGPDATGVAGHRGFFYHFLDMETGLRFEMVELSTIDTTLLLAGILACQAYFDGADPDEVVVRALADSLYFRVDWPWAQEEPPLVSMGWRPERGMIEADWRGYNEAMILLVLALGSPTHPIEPEAWEAWTNTYRWEEFYDEEHVVFAPLFGHQYSHVWIDFRGIQDDYMREKGIDYFENSRRATRSQRAYAIDNPMAWDAYGADVWGLTASDGPADTTLVIDGRRRTFYSYRGRGAAPGEIHDDGTLAPTAAGGSIPFEPVTTTAALVEMRRRWGDHLFNEYGFLDAFNPTLSGATGSLEHGRVVPGVGWFDVDQLGIDQGPIVLMIENHRTGLVWEVMKRSPHVVRGLCRAGFQGGWLDGRCPVAGNSGRPDSRSGGRVPGLR